MAEAGTPPRVAFPFVKVCGVRTGADAAPALRAGLSAVGLVAHPASPRHVSFDQASAVIAAVPPSVLTVVVLVDRDRALAERWIEKTGAGAVQLCGHEDPAQWTGFRAKVLRRIAVAEGAEREIEAWRSVAALYVLDHPASPGGTGQEVDLARAADLAARAPCLLAGGLDANNVAEYVARVRPHGVDASSRLESAPGKKDPALVLAFVRAAHAALSALPKTTGETS